MLEEIENPADVRVRYFSRELDFTFETLVSSLIRGDLGANGFQSDVFVEFEIRSLVELSHAATRDETHDSKAT